MSGITILSQTPDTVTVSRRDWEGLLDQIDDQQDRKAIAVSERNLADRVTFTAEETRRMVLDDVAALTILRERKGLTQAALAVSAGISKTYLNEIEKGKKPGSVEAIKKLAVALDVPMDVLAI